MNGLDQLIIGNKASVDDFDASLKERTIKAPKKKSIKETVPFSNVTYDFSAINGELYWGERQLSYVFEIIADKPEEMESKKNRFSGWVMNVMNECIYDPYEPGWHYVGTFDGIEFKDDGGMEKTTITVTFSAYPYKIADAPTVFTISVPAGETVTAKIVNESSHRLTPTFITNAPLFVQFDGASFSVLAGETTDDSCKIKAGETYLTIQSAQPADYILTVKFFREVF